MFEFCVRQFSQLNSLRSDSRYMLLFFICAHGDQRILVEINEYKTFCAFILTSIFRSAIEGCGTEITAGQKSQIARIFIGATGSNGTGQKPVDGQRNANASIGTTVPPGKHMMTA